MAHRTKINGTAYEISGGKTKINGTGYSISKGRTKVGGTGYDVSFGVSYDPTFANNDWATIIAVCQAGICPDEWSVGNNKTMTINGTSYTIDIIGKNHDTYSSGGTAPLTFQLRQCYATTYRMSSSGTTSGGYDSTEMHSSTLPSIRNQMPSEVRTAIKQVSKKTTSGSGSTSVETIGCYLFLLSEVEITGETSYSASGEGSQYAYYENGGSKKKYKGSSLTDWWTRSPNVRNTTSFCNMNTYGIIVNNSPRTALGVSFAFCF